ncbi:MAG: hypothetical protein RBJ76_26855 [Stenomitos frigidus ULC029]
MRCALHWIGFTYLNLNESVATAKVNDISEEPLAVSGQQGIEDLKADSQPA